jgi:sulfur relay protein TusB/DsrH
MLHIVSQSPFQHSALEQAANYCQQDDVVILSNDAVYALQGPHPLLQVLLEKEVSIKALANDCKARGILNLTVQHTIQQNIEQISVADFVDAVFNADKNLSWY